MLSDKMTQLWNKFFKQEKMEIEERNFYMSKSFFIV